MSKIHTFERFESKYILNEVQTQALKDLYGNHLMYDSYSHSKLSSVYFDTDDYRITRASIDAMGYKEKLRVRRYESQQQEASLFVEIKRKVDGVVYKRREQITGIEAVLALKEKPQTALSQIESEVRYLLDCVDNIAPRILISCRRIAYRGVGDINLRMTLDWDVKSYIGRVDSFNMNAELGLLDEGQSILEVKSKLGYPSWFLAFIDAYQLQKQSFSKVGTAFSKYWKGVTV